MTADDAAREAAGRLWSEGAKHCASWPGEREAFVFGARWQRQQRPDVTQREAVARAEAERRWPSGPPVMAVAARREWARVGYVEGALSALAPVQPTDAAALLRGEIELVEQDIETYRRAGRGTDWSALTARLSAFRRALHIVEHAQPVQPDPLRAGVNGLLWELDHMDDAARIVFTSGIEVPLADVRNRLRAAINRLGDA